MKDFATLEKSKDSFFDSIIHFKKVIILDLKSFKTLNGQDLQELDDILASIEKHRGQGGPHSSVYWNGTMPDYGKAQAKLYDLIAKAANSQVPIVVRSWDFVKETMATPLFVGRFILVLLGVLLGIAIKSC